MTMQMTAETKAPRTSPSEIGQPELTTAPKPNMTAATIVAAAMHCT
jgi:hypothetical protein